MKILDFVTSFFYSIHFKIKCLNKYVVTGLAILTVICIIVFCSFFSLTTGLMEIGEEVSPAINITHLDFWKNDRTFKCNSVYMYRKNDQKIKISLKKGASTYSLESILRFIDSSPDNLLLGCTDIIVSPDEIQTESIVDETVINEYEAFTYQTTMFFHDAYICYDTFFHEAGHIFDIHNGYPSQSSQFKEFYDSENFSNVIDMSMAACDSYYEGWAIATAVYNMKPYDLEKVYPELFDYLSEIYTN